ncbi:MAG: glycogen synthase GlgA [Desulfobacterales bacterium]|jgi:starch synthase|nr:glycogen synthase GlgA [Desulfobacterales bacterium]
MKILFVSPEIAPFAKTGGLADVARALPKAIRTLGHDIRSVMPKYPSVSRSGAILRPVASFFVPMHNGRQKAVVHRAENDGVPIYFVENEAYFNRDGHYGIGNWDYPDNLERFVFFCKAALAYCQADGFSPDIIHCNDWQTASLPAILKLRYRKNAGTPVFSNAPATIFSIHNSAYQGLFPASQWPVLTLPDSYYTYDFEYYGQINLMKSAVIHADILHTVSETYAREIQTTEFGFGLQGVFQQRSDDFYGILNGVDYDEWNPAIDPHTYGIQYSPDDLSGKQAIRSRLRAEFHLPDRDDFPLIGMTSRLVAQKGIDLITACAEGILHLGAQLIMLGDGEHRYRDFFEWLLRKYPDQVGVYIGYNNDLAHKIIAGADLFLMPSHFEPCGLTQIYSLKYGTLPVVRLTGGLADTIRDGVNGFTFFDYSPHFFYEAVKRACTVFRHGKNQWRRMMATAMNEDFSWQRSAEKILDMYRKALHR